MSFLLLKKSSSRSSSNGRGLNSFHHSKQILSAKNPPRVSSSRYNANASDDDPRSFSTSFHGLRQETIESGSGEMQIQRLPTTQQQQKQQQKQHDQLITNQQHQLQSRQQQQQANTQNDVISMDEVMEDLRILEQQQRESQRNLAAIKVIKQHKIDQRYSLDAKLSSLKFSNGEAQFELNHSRQVLSNSQRDLAAAKLRSERSNDNLKKFDTKLKKAFDTLRGLHLKRRKMEEMMVLLQNVFSNLDVKEKDMGHKIKQLELDLEDAKYRESLLIKSIQSSKMKKQALVDETGKMRSELSILENDLTNVQQIEIQTKIRLEQRRSDIEKEKSRFDEARAQFEQKMKSYEVTKSELEEKIRVLNMDSDKYTQVLDIEWKKCVEIQKVEGHKISEKSQDAFLNVSAIRDNLDNLKVVLATQQKEKISMGEKIQSLDAELIDIEAKNDLVGIEKSKELTEIERTSDIENKRRSDINSFKNDVAEQQKRKEELNNTLESFRKEKNLIENDFKEKKKHIQSKVQTEKEKLIALTLEFDELNHKNSELEKDIAHEKSQNAVRIATAKHDAEKSNEALKELQSRFEKLEQTETNQVQKEEEEESRIIAEISSQQQMLLTGHPCLASIDLSSDPYTSKDEQVNIAISKFRASYEEKIHIARKTYEEWLKELKENRRVKELKENQRFKELKETQRLKERKEKQDGQREIRRIEEKKSSSNTCGALQRQMSGSRHEKINESSKRIRDKHNDKERKNPAPSLNDLIHLGHRHLSGTSKRNYYDEGISNDADSEIDSSILRSSKKIRGSYGTTSIERKREKSRNESTNIETNKKSKTDLQKGDAYMNENNSPQPDSKKTFVFPPKRADKVRFHESTYIDADSIPDSGKTSSKLLPVSRSNEKQDENVELCSTSRKSVLKVSQENGRVHSSRRRIIPSTTDAQTGYNIPLKAQSSPSSKGRSSSKSLAKKRCPSKSSSRLQQSDEKQKTVHKSSSLHSQESSRKNAKSKSAVNDPSQLSKIQSHSKSFSTKSIVNNTHAPKSQKEVGLSNRIEVKDKAYASQQSTAIANSRRRKKNASTARKSAIEPNSIMDFSFLDE